MFYRATYERHLPHTFNKMKVVSLPDGAVQPKEYKGIRYVHVSDLTSLQQNQLDKTAVEMINILIDGCVLSDCIQYNDYLAWYQQVNKLSDQHL